MLLGIVTAVIFLLLAAKFITKRLPCSGPDKLFLHIHKVCGCLLPLAAGVHAARMLRERERHSPAACVLGILLLFGVGMLMFSHFFTKMLGSVWIKLHRAATVFTGACLALHAAVAVSGRRKA